ncbi:conserved phage C-terminal domain-containing protein [Allopusillimonas ginsengisoli]|uniref:conserved phage C-terminal domain-containing protein n=1 Tax=Allopusillimonas ginsengisoli TaxID=453575 RepID=UPI0039C34E58
MAGEWIKFEASTPDKTEVLAITVAMGWDDPDLTVGKLLRVWRWFDQQTIDGNAVGVTPALLDRLIGVSGLCEAMQSVGWLEVYDGGITLPNFERHNGKTAKNRALTAKRVANHKTNTSDNAKGNASNVNDALPREEKRREDIKALSGSPDISTSKDAKDVLEYLNLKTGRSYRPVPANIDLIIARLKDGVSLADCKSVVDAKTSQWGDDDKMREYLRPGTLFNRTKFEQYLGQLGESACPADDSSAEAHFARMGL